MNPKEKADELIDKMYYVGRYDDKEDYNPAMAWERAKQCALMAVDVVLAQLVDDGLYIGGETNINEYIKYWQEVKQEIEKL